MIGLVLVTYGHYPLKLVESVESSGLDVRWYVHHHGENKDFAQRIHALFESRNARIYMHLENRGLARSWNDGIHAIHADDGEYAMLVNDDLHFVKGGFGKFIDFARAKENYGLAYVNGLETGGSPLAGQTKIQGMGCGIVTRSAIEKIGWFDQNFAPAYYEDWDYEHRRFHLSVAHAICDDVLVEHERNKTSRDNPEIKRRVSEIMHLNRDYYERKWNVFVRDGDDQQRFLNEIQFERPFNQPQFNYKIEWQDREDPYPGFRQGLNELSR